MFGAQTPNASTLGSARGASLPGPPAPAKVAALVSG